MAGASHRQMLCQPASFRVSLGRCRSAEKAWAMQSWLANSWLPRGDIEPMQVRCKASRAVHLPGSRPRQSPSGLHRLDLQYDDQSLAGCLLLPKLATRSRVKAVSALAWNSQKGAFHGKISSGCQVVHLAGPAAHKAFDDTKASRDRLSGCAQWKTIEGPNTRQGWTPLPEKGAAAQTPTARDKPTMNGPMLPAHTDC